MPGSFAFAHPADWRVEQHVGFIRLIPPGSDTGVEHYRVVPAALPIRPTDPRLGPELDAQFAPSGLRRTTAARLFAARGGQGADFVFDGENTRTGVSMRMRILAVAVGRQTVLVVGAGPRLPVDRRETQLRDIASSLVVDSGGAGLKSGSGSDSPLVRQWADRLRGRKLTYLTSYSSGSAGGYSGRTVILLDEDGSFSYRSNSSMGVDAGGLSGGAGGTGSGEGRWRVSSQSGRAVLELNFNSGEVSRYLLTYEAGKTFLNGRRFFVTDP